MKEKDKKAVEAEIEKKTSNEVSDNDIEGVSGGLGNCADKVSLNNCADKVSLNNRRSLNNSSKLSTSSLASKD